MDSKRRIVEIKVWDYPFFSDLDQTEKNFYWFNICKCDNVGVYQHNAKLAAFHCGREVNLQSFVEKVNANQQQIEIIGNNSLWWKDFVRETWGTLSAGNNQGIAGYKLLVKHGLLQKFYSLYPNCINIKSFREAITEGKLNLPLPIDTKNSVSREHEGQSRGRAATFNINNNITNSINDNISNTPSLHYHKKAKSILEVYPTSETDNSILPTIEDVLKRLEEEGITDAEKYLLNETEKLDEENIPKAKSFFESILERDELPF